MRRNKKFAKITVKMGKKWEFDTQGERYVR